MPQINISKKNKSPFQELMKNFFRETAALLVRQCWSVIPRNLYLAKSDRSLSLALTRLCNVNCVFCPYQFVDKGEKIHIPEETFEKILNDMREAGIKDVQLSPNVGEPTLVPNFIDKVKALRKAGATMISLTTNATVLQKIGIESLLTDGPDRILISFAGFDEAMYRRVYRSPLYDRVRANVLDLLRANAAAGKPRQIILQLRGDMSVAENENLPEMREAKQLADEVFVMTEVDDWIGMIKQEMLPEGFTIQKTKSPLTKRPCAKLFDLTIHPDGDVHLCNCRNIFNDPGLHIGKIHEITISEAYSRIPAILNKWERGKYPRICWACSMYIDSADYFLGKLRRIMQK